MADTKTTLQASAPVAERLLYGPPDWVVIGSEANGTTAATVAAATGKQHFPQKAVVSFSGQPATALTFTIKDGSTTIFQAEIPAAVTAPISFDFSRARIHGTITTALTGNLAAAGSGITGTIWMCGQTMTPG
jgi:hypothetical protein